jgi:methyl-accepting chemotaxis protein
MLDPHADTVMIARRSPLTGWFVHLRISLKIMIALLTITALAIVIGVVALSRMSAINSTIDRIRSQYITGLSDVSDMRGAQSQINNGVASIAFAAGDAATIADNTKKIKSGEAAMDAALTAYQKVAGSSAEQRAAISRLSDEWTMLKYGTNAILFHESVPAGVTVPTNVAEFNTLIAETTGTISSLADLEQRAANSAGDSAAADYRTARTTVLVALVIGVLTAVLLAVGVARVITRPLHAVSKVLFAIADGDLTGTAEVNSRDEAGQMAVAVNRASGSIRNAIRALATGADALNTKSADLSQVSEHIATSAAQTSSQANEIAQSAEKVSYNVGTVSSGAEEMGVSIREIAHNASESAKVASQAVEVVESTNTTVGKLGDSSAEIGSVVKVITSIAEQTNLLALNATIEAARAGDAGKGFAVVAGEVKELAQETARATEDISRRVEAIQADTESAVAAIAQISSIIARINDYQVTIASAVEEQTATTQEMNRNVADAASGSSSIAGTISSLAASARSTAEVVGDSQRTASDMARLSAELRELVTRFRY